MSQIIKFDKWYEPAKDEDKRQGVQYMLTTVHPDNIASNTSLKHLGYKVIKEFSRAGKRRNLLVLDLTKE